MGILYERISDTVVIEGKEKLCKDAIYIGALLHDIGKFVERGKVYNNSKVKEKYNDINRHAHSRFSKYFLNDKCELHKELVGNNKEQILDIVGYHHQPKSFEHKIVQLADWLASSEREKDPENKEYYNKVRLRSIFGKVFQDKLNDETTEEVKKQTYNLESLSIGKLFPVNKKKDIAKESDGLILQDQYGELTNTLKNEISSIENKEELLYLIEKYLSQAPAQTIWHDPDLSLYDHCRLTAAIALCLYYQVENNQIDEEYLDKILKYKTFQKEKNNHIHCIIITGDLSGIQNFVYNIPSKGAAKSLKARSVYITLLTEVLSRYILDKLELERANLIYNGGGVFHILAPKCKESDISEIKKHVAMLLFEYHSTGLSCNICSTDVSFGDFEEFDDGWKRIQQSLDNFKLNKFSHHIYGDEKDLDEFYNQYFQEKELVKEGKHCHICNSMKEVLYNQESEKNICQFCQSLIELNDKLKPDDNSIFTINFDKTKKNENDKNIYSSVFKDFGYEVKFNEKNKHSYSLNNVSGKKWYISTLQRSPINELNDLVTPEKDRELKQNDKLRNGRLAYIKLDVDNLGNIFATGLASSNGTGLNSKSNSFSRMTFLSRMFKFFFEGYIEEFIRENEWQNDIYTIFSGGDDTFIITNIETGLFFIKEFRKKFKAYVAGNPSITFSAGLAVFDAKHPVIHAAKVTENFLETSKTTKYLKKNGDVEEKPTKDKITILGEVFNWDEYDYILKLKKIITDILDTEGTSRGILYKIINSTKGFKPLLEQSQRGKLTTQRIWRLRYYLRQGMSQVNAKKIIDIYEDMWLKNMFNKHEIKNHQIITVAVKLVDLATRKET